MACEKNLEGDLVSNTKDHTTPSLAATGNLLGGSSQDSQVIRITPIYKP